jgi:hypothetical protein
MNAEPQMSDHSLFETCRVDLDAADMPAQIAAGLQRVGVVTFECDPARTAVLALSRRLLVPCQHRDADPDGITIVTGREALASRPGYAGFGTGELQPHTELSSAPSPPALLMLTCGRASNSGGASVIVDGASVYADLTSHGPGLAAELSRPGSATFGSPGWPGAVFEPEPDGWLTIRLRLDDLARFTPDARFALPRLREAVARHVTELRLQPGTGFLIDNRRILHGRRAFTGQRVIYRILGHAAPGLTFRPGFGPPGRLASTTPHTDPRPHAKTPAGPKGPARRELGVARSASGSDRRLGR